MKRVTFKRRFLLDLDRMHETLGREFELETFYYTVELLAEGRPLPASLNPHALAAGWRGYDEYHLAADWLVIYQERRDEIIFWRSGTHKDLFRRTP